MNRHPHHTICDALNVLMGKVDAAAALSIRENIAELGHGLDVWLKWDAGKEKFVPRRAGKRGPV